MHAFDLRGHGQTHTTQDDDLSIETLVQDTLNVLDHVIPPTVPKTDDAPEPESPQTIIVGHRYKRVRLNAVVGVLSFDLTVLLLFVAAVWVVHSQCALLPRARCRLWWASW